MKRRYGIRSFKRNSAEKNNAIKSLIYKINKNVHFPLLGLKAAASKGKGSFRMCIKHQPLHWTSDAFVLFQVTFIFAVGILHPCVLLTNGWLPEAGKGASTQDGDPKTSPSSKAGLTHTAQSTQLMPQENGYNLQLRIIFWFQRELSRHCERL